MHHAGVCRFSLKVLGSDKSTEYINANWVKGPPSWYVCMCARVHLCICARALPSTVYRLPLPSEAVTVQPSLYNTRHYIGDIEENSADVFVITNLLSVTICIASGSIWLYRSAIYKGHQLHCSTRTNRRYSGMCVNDKTDDM